MRLRLSLAVVLVISLVMAAVAEVPWNKKNWKQWSRNDCKKILEDSPWAQRWNQTEAKMADFATRTSGTEGVGSESELSIFYIVQFRSARPIREALVRQMLIANRYDQLEPPQQEAMEKEVEKQTGDFLNRNYDDIIVVHVIYGSNVAQYSRELTRFWQTHYPEGTVPQEAFLHGPRGQRLTPLKLISHKGGEQEFELIFPRMVEGKPLLQPGDKSVRIEFMSPGAGKLGSSRVFVEFKADKMMLDGQMAY